MAVVEAGAEDGGEEANAADPVADSPYADMIAAADKANGEKIFGQCRACHTVNEGDANRVGPNLWAIVGRDIAAIDAFSYSTAMAAEDGAWTVDRLFTYLENPRANIQGTKMVFRGIKDAQDRMDLIVWLNDFGGDAPEIP